MTHVEFDSGLEMNEISGSVIDRWGACPMAGNEKSCENEESVARCWLEFESI